MAQDLIVNGVTYNGVGAVTMTNTDGEQVAFYPDAVRYNAQTLTEAQKAQARENIGAVSETVFEAEIIQVREEITDLQSYELSDADKAEIAEMVDGATVVQAPQFVNSVDEMTDTSRVYVLASTGKIWAYKDSTHEEEVTVTDQIVGTTDNPYEVGRLSGSGTVSADVSTHVVSPYIDLTKAEYQGKRIQLHLAGNQYAAASGYEPYVMVATFKADKTVINGRAYVTPDMSVNSFLGDFDSNEQNMVLEVNSDTSATITMNIPLVSDTGPTEVGYLRFCGKGTEAASNIYITYTDIQTVTGGGWVDTGTSYAPALTDEDKTEIAEQVASLIDTQLLSVIGDGVVTV